MTQLEINGLFLWTLQTVQPGMQSPEFQVLGTQSREGGWAAVTACVTQNMRGSLMHSQRHLGPGQGLMCIHTYISMQVYKAQRHNC